METYTAIKVPERLEKESASHFAKRVLIYNIEHLRLKPGEQLQEQALADRLQLSRTPVHEAVLELKRRELLRIIPHHGTFVSWLPERADDGVRDLRYVYESTLIQRASERRDPEIIARMLENVGLQLAEGIRNRDRFFELDDEFHRLLYVMDDREDCYRIVKEHSLQFNRMRYISYDLETTQELIAEHAAMVDAIKNGNGVLGKTLMEHHLRRALADYARIRQQVPQYFEAKEESGT